MCNFHGPAVVPRREKGFMSPELAVELVRQIASSATEKTWLALHGAGEPLLYPHLGAVLKETARSPLLDAGFLTNAVLLDREALRGLIDIPFSWIGFSIDGTRPDLFERYRCGARYDRVVENALHAVERLRCQRPDVKITVNMTLQKEMKDDVPDFVRFWLGRADHVSISPCKPPGSRHNPLVEELPPKARIPCYMVRDMFIVYWDGTVGLCCEDWFGDEPMGNVTGESIAAVWNGAGFARVRRLHDEGRYSELPLCADCDSWYNALPEVSYDETLSCSVIKTAWQTTYSVAGPQ